MLAENSQHSGECWLWAIPKSVAPTPPRFTMGQLVKLSDMYQLEPYTITYGQIVGVEWDVIFSRWLYSVQVPNYHNYYDDIEILKEFEVEQRLLKEKSNA
jgi:hypothetical protein